MSKAMSKNAKIAIVVILAVVIIALAIILPIVLRKKPEPPFIPDIYEITEEQVTTFNTTLGNVLKLGVSEVGLSKADYEKKFEEGKEHEDYLFYKLKSDTIVNMMVSLKKARITTSSFSKLTGYIGDISEELSDFIDKINGSDAEDYITTTFTEIYLEVLKGLEVLNATFNTIENDKISDALIGDTMYYFIDSIFSIAQDNKNEIELYLAKLHLDYTDMTDEEKEEAISMNGVESTIITLGLELMPVVQEQYRNIGIDTISSYYENYFSASKKLSQINLSLFKTISEAFEGTATKADYEVLIGSIEREIADLANENGELLTIPADYYDMITLISSKTANTLKLLGYDNTDKIFAGINTIKVTEKMVNTSYKSVKDVIAMLKTDDARQFLARNEVLIEIKNYEDDITLGNPEFPMAVSANTKANNDRFLFMTKIVTKLLGDKANYVSLVNVMDKFDLISDNRATSIKEDFDILFEQMNILSGLEYGTLIFDEKDIIVYEFKKTVDGKEEIVENDIASIMNYIFKFNAPFNDVEIDISNYDIKLLTNGLLLGISALVGLPVLTPFAIPTFGMIVIGGQNENINNQIMEMYQDLLKLLSPIGILDIA